MIKDIDLADILKNDQALKFFIELIDNYIKIYAQIGSVGAAKEEENVEPLDVIDNIETAGIEKEFTNAAKHLEKASKDYTKGELIRAGFKETIIDKLLSFAFDILSNKELDVRTSPVDDVGSDLDESKQNKASFERMIKEELKVLNGKKMVSVIDTSVYLSDSSCLTKFGNNDIIVPLKVLAKSISIRKDKILLAFMRDKSSKHLMHYDCKEILRKVSELEKEKVLLSLLAPMKLI